jgi:hypothetical protein
MGRSGIGGGLLGAELMALVAKSWSGLSVDGKQMT